MRVTERAQHAVTYAKQEAGRLGHDRAGTEHLLLGLLHDEQCLAVVTLGGLGISPETVRRRVEETVGQGPGQPGMGLHLPTTKPFTLVLALAGREAMELDHDRLGTEDLLLGLAREGEGVAARALQQLGAGLLELREAVAARYAGGVDPEPFPPDRGPPPWEPPPSARLPILKRRSFTGMIGRYSIPLNLLRRRSKPYSRTVRFDGHWIRDRMALGRLPAPPAPASATVVVGDFNGPNTVAGTAPLPHLVGGGPVCTVGRGAAFGLDQDLTPTIAA